MIRNSGQLVFALQGFAVESLNILKDVPESYQAGSDFLRGQPVKHVSVIGIRTVGANDFHYGTGGHISLSLNLGSGLS